MAVDRLLALSALWANAHGMTNNNVLDILNSRVLNFQLELTAIHRGILQNAKQNSQNSSA